MKQNQEYKNEALAALRGNWAPAVLATLVYYLLTLFLISPYEVAVFRTNSADIMGLMAASRWYGVFFLGMILVIGPFLVGYVNSFKKLLVEGDDRITANSFREGFKPYWRSVWAYLFRGILITLWSLLLVIPGIIKSLSYAMTMYIVKDHPELTVNEAIDMSKDMMYGHKYDLFYLYISFIGWYLLSILTLGIGTFWLMPYIETAQASFYEDVKAEWELKSVG
ncbi:MAG: DUF975 family protein [Candidatus Cryptobacteroides sp.]|nr:DUF975 family protein [Candidatus Cryptobacteroides sp.]